MMSYKPCRCGGLAACYCGQSIETRFLKIRHRYNRHTDPFWAVIDALTPSPNNA